MNAVTRPDGALASPKPSQSFCVFSLDKKPLPRIASAVADILCARGWARWVGHGTRLHLQMLVEVPELPHGGRGDGTRPMRADATCRRYAPGQNMMGDGKLIREHILGAGR